MKNNKKEILERIAFLMNYDLSKTSKENFILKEQPDSRFDSPERKKFLAQSAEEQKKQEDFEKSQEKLFEECKYFCRYPENAICPPKNQAGFEGPEAMIQGYCYYMTPPLKSSNTYGGIFIPNNAGINFFDNSNIEKTLAKFMENIIKEYPIMYDTKLKKELLFADLTRLFKNNMVKNFRTNDGVFKISLQYNEPNGPWEFIGYYGEKGEYYYQPEWKDERTEYQKFIDRWGDVTQIAVAVASAFVGALTGGAAWAITLEIITEMGLGIMVGARDLEKGENISAFTSFITGVLPFGKLLPELKGISRTKFNSLAEKIANSGLGETPTEEALEKFIKEKLDDDENLILKKLLRGDEASIAQMQNKINKITTNKIELEKVFLENLEETLKQNPDIFKKIEFWDRLWVRELSANVVVGVIGLTMNLTLGRKLNDKEIEILDGIYVLTPDGLKKELAYNIGNQPEVFDNYLNSPDSEKDLIELANSKKTATSENFAINYKKMMENRFNKNGGPYIHLNGNTTNTSQNTTTEEILRKDGWVPIDEWTKGDYEELKTFKGKDWVK